MRANAKSITAAQRKRTRNRAALVLFGRSVVITLSVISGIIGFLAGTRMQASNYDPYAYATGVAALFAVACAVIAYLLIRRRAMRREMRRLEARVEELSDQHWELREAEERARSLLDAQGDLIVRRDGAGPHHLRQRRVLRARRPPPRRADRQGSARPAICRCANRAR